MSKEHGSSGSFFDKTDSKLSLTERRIQKLFRRAGWDELPTRETRHQAVRDEFQNLFMHALLDENSPYKIHETSSREEDHYTVAIKKDDTIIAAKTTYNRQSAGKLDTIYNVVKKTVPWRRDLVFQLIEYSPIDNIQQPSKLNIGYYESEKKAKFIITDKR